MKADPLPQAVAAGEGYLAAVGPRGLVAIAALALLTPAFEVASQPITTTFYVGSHFEVRDHDQPTKYVFDGATRVAEITGSLSANHRIQRIRLYTGWNLISLAVGADDLAGQLAQNFPAGVDAIYQWLPVTGQSSAVTPGQSIGAGAVLWVKADTNVTVGIIGTYSDPSDLLVPAAGSYVPGSGLEAWTPSLPPTASGWFYVAQTNLWQEQLAGPIATASSPPWTLAPGQAMYVKADAPMVLSVPDPSLRIRYYHEDHLGSSSVITDQAGNLVQETAFYPFGHSRHESTPRLVADPYQFSQKERDTESGLHYFGKRFYDSMIGKWASADPIQEQGGGLNLYAYANENPLKYYDPNGAEVKVSYKESGNKGVYHIDVKAVVVNASSHPFSRQDLQNYASSLEDTIKKSYSGSISGKFDGKFHGRKGTISWSTTVSIEVIADPSTLKPDDPRHVFRIVDVNTDEHNHAKGSAAGTANVGGRVMNIGVATFTQKLPSEVDESLPGNKGYARAYESPQTVGAHELGHDLGLSDFYRDVKNLMSEDRLDDSAVIRLDQVQQIYQQYQSHNLNRSDEELVKEGKSVH